VTLLRQEGWTRWPTEVPSNPYHSVILWYCESNWALAQVAQTGGGVSILGDTQKLSGHGPGQQALGGPCVAGGGWTRWPQEDPSNLNHSMWSLEVENRLSYFTVHSCLLSICWQKKIWEKQFQFWNCKTAVPRITSDACL